MNAIKYLHNRFSFAVKNNGTIKVNQQDVEAINKLVESQEKENTELEDSLLLFYVFWNYTIENENNKAEIKEKGIDKIKYPLGINTPYNLLNHLSKVIEPKKLIIDKIHEQLWIYQEYERVCKNQEIREQELRDIEERNSQITETDENGITSHFVTRQEMIPIPKEEFISIEEVTELLEKTLKAVKKDFPMIKYLKDGLWKN